MARMIEMTSLAMKTDQKNLARDLAARRNESLSQTIREALKIGISLGVYHRNLQVALALNFL